MVDNKSMAGSRQAGGPTRVLACLEMKREKLPKPDDFAPLPKKPLLVKEDEFDKVIWQLLKSSPIGITRLNPRASATLKSLVSGPSSLYRPFSFLHEKFLRWVSPFPLRTRLIELHQPTAINALASYWAAVRPKQVAMLG